PPAHPLVGRSCIAGAKETADNPLLSRAATHARHPKQNRSISMAMFTHVTVGTNDLGKARSFYDSVLAPLGYQRLKDLGENGSIWGQSAPEFFVLRPAN